MTVGERIKLQRERKGLSQTDLAKIMNVSRQVISKDELHDNNLTTVKVAKYAKALGTTPAHLMGWEDDEPDILPLDDDTVALADILSKGSSNPTYKVIIDFLKAYSDATEEEQQAIDNVFSRMNNN